jgi:hypothetical protein
LGGLHNGGGFEWKEAYCDSMHNDFNSHFVRKDGTKARGMLEVLELLGNRTLIFAGDSVGSQIGR